ncbi:hypothetical protein MKW98_009926 [Papaver atlanticum]|uniref:Uncharacterized protein n=1 Tax=Papaver atlanticum TaxID=357466 RepID=A0AAD4T3B6_9MAGN|nr:hypothetical protein MKW98_009926 [Papaver atlanticum]
MPGTILSMEDVCLAQDLLATLFPAAPPESSTGQSRSASEGAFQLMDEFVSTYHRRILSLARTWSSCRSFIAGSYDPYDRYGKTLCRPQHYRHHSHYTCQLHKILKLNQVQ